MKLFRNKMIYFINDGVSSTREALITGILPLINNEYIKKRYVDEVLKQFRQNPHQYILNEYVLILHTNPDQELSIKNGISLTHFTTPISLESKKCWQYIIAIAAIDQKSQQDLLEKAQYLFNNKKIIKKLNGKNSLKEFINELENHDL